MSLLKNCENLLIDILRLMMFRIKKARRFMYFLDAVVKNMKQVQKCYSCFRIILTGKIRGGTKRTKILVVGFGQVSWNSLNAEAGNLYLGYTHKYGAFGMRFFFNKIFKDKRVPKKIIRHKKMRARSIFKHSWRTYFKTLLKRKFNVKLIRKFDASYLTFKHIKKLLKVRKVPMIKEKGALVAAILATKAD